MTMTTFDRIEKVRKPRTTKDFEEWWRLHWALALWNVVFSQTSTLPFAEESLDDERRDDSQ